jgi:chloramphenicol 3-O phosphotransferase
MTRPGWAGPAAGRVILLNGTSSSGKSSIAEQLLDTLPEPYFHLPADAFNSMRSRRRTAELDEAELAAVLGRTRAGFHRAVAAMASAGNNVVADLVLSERWRLVDCLAVLADCEVVFVGVRCPPEELARREAARGDREAGQAARQLAQVHAHGIYDVECNTSVSSPAECARLISEFVSRRRHPAAFEQLRGQLAATDRPALR